MISSTGGRLSPYNITDDLIRVELYREIRQAQEDSAKRQGGNWAFYTIQPADELKPELIAYHVYGLDTLKWLVSMSAGLKDDRGRLEVGKKIYLPKTEWLRERIKHYMGMCK